MQTPQDEGRGESGEYAKRFDTERRAAAAPNARPAGSPKPPAPDAAVSRRRRYATYGVVVLMVVLVGLGATSLLGRNASSKFSAVAMAICDSRLSRAVAGSGPIHAGVVGFDLVGRGGSDGGDDGKAELAQGCGGGAAVASSSGDPSPASSGSAGSSRAPNAGASRPAATPAAQTSFGANAVDAPTSPGPAAAGHAFVSTATMTVRVAGDTAKAVADKKREALAIAAGAGGGLFGEESTFDGVAKATITLKIPSGQFTKVLDDLAALGTPEVQQVKTEEVTLQVIDLDARLTAATNGLDRTRGLLSKATNLGDVAQLEADVNRRETEVESLRGQQVALSQRVDLSTVVLSLESSAPVAAAPPAPAVAPPPSPAGFFDGLGAGWTVFTRVGTAVLVAVGAALPFVPILVLVAVPWWLLRRRSRSRLTPAGPAGARAAS